MANITGYQEEYIKAYEILSNRRVNVSALMMIAENEYDEILKLIEYKSNPETRALCYDKKINTHFTSILTIFFEVEDANSIYKTYRTLFAKKYLDNKDDDTNDYSDETMSKLNKIYSFIDNNSEKNFDGTELLSAIRKEVNGVEEEVEDNHYNALFNDLKKQSDYIKTHPEDRMNVIPAFLEKIAELEHYLFNAKLFYDDYRKSVTGLTNYLLMRAGLPLIYIKPVELDDYYSYINNPKKQFNTNDAVTFYREKMSESISEALVAPMKKNIKSYNDAKIKRLLYEPDNGVDRIRI